LCIVRFFFILHLLNNLLNFEIMKNLIYLYPWFSLIVFMIVYISMRAWSDYHRLLDKQLSGKESLKHNKFWHILEAFIFSMVACTVFIALIRPQTTKQFIFAMMFFFFLRWNLFDPILNLLRKLPFFYKGTVSLTDTINIPNVIYFALKLFGLGFSIQAMFELF